MRILFIGLIALLVGCIDIHYPPEGPNTSTTRVVVITPDGGFKTTEESKPVEEVLNTETGVELPSPIVDDNLDCGVVFRLPETTPIPDPDRSLLSESYHPDALEQVLVQYINQLRELVRSDRSRIEKAHDRYLVLRKEKCS